MTNRQAGFTITEVLVAVTVTTAMILVVSNYMMRNIQTSSQQTQRALLLSEVQIALDNIGSSIRLSANADGENRNPDSNSPGGSADVYGWSSDASTVVLATAATTSNGTVIFSDAANYVTTKNNIVYFVSGGTLYRRMIADTSASGNSAKTSCPNAKVTSSCPADKALMKNVTAFTVSYLDGSNAAVTPTDARSIEISLTAGVNKYHLNQTVSYKTRMVFRND